MSAGNLAIRIEKGKRFGADGAGSTTFPRTHWGIRDLIPIQQDAD